MNLHESINSLSEIVLPASKKPLYTLENIEAKFMPDYQTSPESYYKAFVSCEVWIGKPLFFITAVIYSKASKKRVKVHLNLYETGRKAIEGFSKEYINAWENRVAFEDKHLKDIKAKLKPTIEEWQRKV